MMNAIHEKIRMRIEGVKKRLKAINRPITVKNHSEEDAGFVAESVIVRGKKQL